MSITKGLIAASLMVFATAATASAQVDGQQNVIVIPYGNYGPQANPWAHPQFYGGYNTGPYVGYYGFYRRMPPTNVPSYNRYYSPYYQNSGNTSPNFRRFGGGDFYGL